MNIFGIITVCLFKKGQEKVVAALVEQRDCELNVQDAEGNTPLHVAIFNQHAAIIELLIRHPNIDLKVRKIGKDPLQLKALTVY